MKSESANDATQNQTLSRMDKNPGGADKLAMGDDGGLDEVSSPKSRIVRESRRKIQRDVTFTESTPNKSVALVQYVDNGSMTQWDNDKAVEDNKRLNEEVLRLDKLVKSGILKRKKDNIKNEKIMGYITGKGNDLELVIEDLEIKLKIARESEEELKIKNISMKTKFSKANSQVKMLTENSKNYDWEMQLIKAKLSGAEAKEDDKSSEPNPKQQLGDKVTLRNEIETHKVRIEALESNAEEDQRTITTLERAISTQKKEVKRLNLADVKYRDLLETHHGGSIRKCQEFMKNANLAADCSDQVIERWRKLNSWKLDEGDMLLLTKLIVSERVIKSRALLVDFLKSSLEFEPNEGEIDETPNAPSKKK